LQDATKEYGCPLVISDDVAQRSRLNTQSLQRRELTVRNRREALAIFVIDDVALLDADVSAASSQAPVVAE
jgi:hypothetical protein